MHTIFHDILKLILKLIHYQLAIQKIYTNVLHRCKFFECIQESLKAIDQVLTYQHFSIYRNPFKLIFITKVFAKSGHLRCKILNPNLHSNKYPWLYPEVY